MQVIGEEEEHRGRGIVWKRRENERGVGQCGEKMGVEERVVVRERGEDVRRKKESIEKEAEYGIEVGMKAGKVGVEWVRRGTCRGRREGEQEGEKVLNKDGGGGMQAGK
ncbi:hypothetical protein Pmani_031064 [Petrolisthes manimaculis]|uniref:Uncharacterized protein n=1 Tax=Petrolisthes manimaculis TaxID=1843537 RepID=A0AAE1TV88_9EUCA|nr:hypothetical protein Pmani_031064 [Petrolisthes manimaculis]